jgi:hypothetical protein
MHGVANPFHQWHDYNCGEPLKGSATLKLAIIAGFLGLIITKRSRQKIALVLMDFDFR